MLAEWEALRPEQASAHACATPSAHAGPGLRHVELPGAGLGSDAGDAGDAGGAGPVHGPRQWVRGTATIGVVEPVHYRDRQLAARIARVAQHQEWRSQGMAQTSPHGPRLRRVAHVESNDAET